MAPRAPTLLSLMSSTGTYPPVPNTEDLESLRSALEAQSSSTATRIAAFPPPPAVSKKTAPAGKSAASFREEAKKSKKDGKKRKEREETDERERAALAANKRAGAALDAVERRRVDPDVKVKNERAASPAPSNASSASFRPGSQATYGGMQKRKKVKRVLDSDDEAAHSTPPPHQASTSGLKLKLAPGVHNKSRPQPVDPSPTPSSTASAPLPGGHIDWTLPAPPQRALVPPRPEVQKPLPAGPKRQSEVNEDYSDKKAPSQIAMATFWQNVEPYIRDIREDDLAMLNFKADTPDSYLIPQRGRHYTEIWDEEDALPPGTTPRFSVPNLRQAANGTHQPPLVHCVPTEIRDANLLEENKGLGSMTERVVAAVIGGDDIAAAAKEQAEKKPEPEGEAVNATRVDVVELEDRVKKELRSVMLLGEHEEFDAANRDDDEVTSALRQCQRLLLQQTAINEARKSRLGKIATDRLAYGEYQGVLEETEKQIEALWAKRIKKHGSSGKKTLQNGVISGNGRPPVPDSLKRLLSVRSRWIETVGRTMHERPDGEVSGLPAKSIYEGIVDENEDGDVKTVDEAMEVDEADEDEVDGTAV
ncbi:Transcriptional regulator [Vanrija albida]|uniref:Transcriptional regulator n=1 Tax=Vanrija albida TaxID=181172 RepID=A0ABR3Q9U6_9TREE